VDKGAFVIFFKVFSSNNINNIEMMKYSDFVKEQMAKMSGSNMKASEKMKAIAQEWHKMKGGHSTTAKATKAPKADKMAKLKLPKEDESEMEKMVRLLGGKKTKAEGAKIVKAVKKFQAVPLEKEESKSELKELVHAVKHEENKQHHLEGLGGHHHGLGGHHHGLGF